MTTRRPSRVGERFEIDTERIAHGGAVVGRHDGVVIFVRHALPGERVQALVTDGREGDRFLRADAVEVLGASPDRVVPPCPHAGPGLCGGCDFQHATPSAQRGLKAAVVREQLQRLAGVEVDVTVDAVDPDDLGWRTRVQWAVDERGSVGLRAHRSHRVVPVDDCRIAHPALPDPRSVDLAGVESVETIVSGAGETLAISRRSRRASYDGAEVLHERAAGRTWQVTGSGFWQVHPQAADTLVDAVLAGLGPRAGERALDLYAGVGLFSGALAEAVGPAGRVIAVEGDRDAVADAAVNLADLPQVELRAATVAQALAAEDADTGADLVVLDPPRVGAKAEVVSAIARLEPRAVAYVACDPAALARDVATFAEHGYRLSSLRAFDLFPMTHHVECVAVLGPDGEVP